MHQVGSVESNLTISVPQHKYRFIRPGYMFLFLADRSRIQHGCCSLKVSRSCSFQFAFLLTTVVKSGYLRPLLHSLGHCTFKPTVDLATDLNQFLCKRESRHGHHCCATRMLSEITNGAVLCHCSLVQAKQVPLTCSRLSLESTVCSL